jgi:AraC family transcriptional regulator
VSAQQSRSGSFEPAFAGDRRRSLPARAQPGSPKSAAGPVGRALWYIEKHLAADLSLNEVADCAGVSCLHLLRAFNAVAGYPMRQYVRARRLTEAACRLAADSDDILSVAMDSGYGSQTAFTRAFLQQFGMTPEAIRDQGLPVRRLVGPLKVNNSAAQIGAPRFEEGGRRLVAGLAERYGDQDGSTVIAGQWRRFAAYFGGIAGQVGNVAYGTNYYTGDDGNLEYLCGVEVADFSSVPRNFGLLCIPAQHWAVFFHREHVSTIHRTWAAIWNQWLPDSGHEAVDAPFFERYGESFDPGTGLGGAELWVPVTQRSPAAM